MFVAVWEAMVRVPRGHFIGNTALSEHLATFRTLAADRTETVLCLFLFMERYSCSGRNYRIEPATPADH